MSCLDQLKSQGYLSTTYQAGVYIDSQKAGNVQYEANKYISIVYIFPPVTQIDLQYNISITCVTKCASAFRIRRLVIYAGPSIVDLFNILTTLLSTMQIIQALLTTLTQSF